MTAETTNRAGPVRAAGTRDGIHPSLHTAELHVLEKYQMLALLNPEAHVLLKQAKVRASVGITYTI